MNFFLWIWIKESNDLKFNLTSYYRLVPDNTIHLIHMWLGCGVLDTAEGAEAVGTDWQGYGEDKSNGAVPGDYLYGGGSVSAPVRKWELSGNGGDYKDLGRIPSLGGNANHRDDDKTWGGQGVEIYPGGGGNGRRGTSSHRRVYQEATDKHSGKGVLPTHLWTLFQGREDAGENTDGERVGPGRGQ